MADAEKIEKCKRRVVAIAGPVYAEFSHICAALGYNRQSKVTGMVKQWNSRHARRAEIRLRQKADALRPLEMRSCPQTIIP